jgi:hypothetical protein
MSEFKLSEGQEQLLHDQVIDAQQPGPVLRDFHTLLEAIGPQGVKAAGKYNLLPLDLIDELDQRLSRPLRLALQRPQLRSHPYLQGLHLLFRASGLGRVEGVGAKARLVVDAAVREAWDRLNPTEQYFTLLEAWLRMGRPEMVGERESSFEPPEACLLTWHRLPAKGKKFDLKRPQHAYLFGVGRDFYHLALMDLFGLVVVEFPKKPVQPWCPAAVRHSPFGDALLTLLAPRAFPDLAFGTGDESEEEETGGAIHFGRWQGLFRPYFPQWQNNLVLPGPEARAGVFVFRVALDKIWRRIAMPADATLDDLVGWILEAVDFDDDHLYEFIYRDRLGRQVRAGHREDEEGPFADEVLIGELPLEPGQSMKLIYDFGDNWQFDVRLESIAPRRGRGKLPRIVEKHGKAPEQYPQWD